ncbi:ROK family transcriptional regulator [Streptomyces qinzhouensis]|uniref:ROK family transcriptional regulator n=1 Tax=Streptomyces qinzhouensis TaxID=2599401 RepID=A0A5B8ICY3_9ACTN|nr:ROK family transcriptional regulator [Streptomyces qinzhouensis]QDY75832.1 ROK family transcriptional regulator [Streptomyces qinzhouensis]
MPASPSTARAINDRLALDFLQREGPLTAGQLKVLTGLSRPSVADLVERLQESGLIRIVGEAGARRRGPNARVYGIAADRAHLAALDVRTQGVSLVVADLLGTTLAEAALPISRSLPTEPAVERAVALLERTARDAGVTRLHSVAVGVPGLIDPGTGELRESGLPGWHRSLAAVLQERLPARIVLENETNLAALAEQRSGAARDRDTFAFLWLGQGVGAALFLDGRIRRGASGGAGEIGFLPVPGTGGLPSASGCDGGFHSLAGSSAIRALAGEFGLKVPEMPERKAAEPTAAEPETPEPAAAVVVASAIVAEAVAAGADDTGADAFLDALAHRIALGAAAVTSILDPGCLVLGGEVGLAGGGELANRVAARLAGLNPLPTEVRPGGLGGTAILHGALLTARDRAQEDLFDSGG